ncbi:hypothetical protein OG225_42350 (plasmid) [Nocardia sp. NBC_01377]|uniref:hypothetical protein n=1 Tax=Nocardia sp. NBC_01377 TaxID=2903595 RepID=UPI002F908A76
MIDLVECHVLPLVRAHNVRLVEVARAGPENEDGIVVLQDTRQPYRMHCDAEEHGFYALSKENRVTGTMPQRSGTRKCTLKFKGWPMDTWRDRELGTRPYFHVIGYNADESKRIENEPVLALGGHRTMAYPVHESGWTRQDCREYLYEIFGVWWPKSLCAECCYVSKREWSEHLSRMLAAPEQAARHLVDEYCAVALNSKSGLFGPDETLDERLRAAGAREILDLATRTILHSPWALYRVRRVYFAPAVAWRSVHTVHRGTPDETGRVLRWLARKVKVTPVTDTRAHTRLWLAQRPPDSKTYPQVECFFVAAPANVADKQRDTFENHWVAHASDALRERDVQAADYLYRRARPRTAHTSTITAA